MNASKALLRANIVANYAGQIYTTLLGVILLPLQAKELGAEGYGLVGFFAVLSGWLQLLDGGLSATLARETANYRANALDSTSYRELLRVVELLFAVVGVGAALTVLVCSHLVAKHWLHPEQLSASTVAEAVALMGLVFALRWQATLSRSVLLGLERQVWLNAVTAVAATLRSVGVLLALRWIEPTPRVFFIYQAAVSGAELLVLRFSARRSLAFPSSRLGRISFEPIRRVAGFSLRVAFTGIVWVFVTQLDKLLLSSFLPLSEYAWFSLAVAAAGGISMLSFPIGQAIQPRLTYFFASGKDEDFRSTYSDATQLLSAIALTASIIAATASRHILWVWTGDVQLANRVATVFSLYALGNGLLAGAAMSYYLQVACGDLRLHVRGNIAFAAVLVPTIAFATARWGMTGAGVVWCSANLLFFLTWSAVVHRKFLPGIHLRWLLRDAALPAAFGLLPSVALGLPDWSRLSRIEGALVLASVGIAAVAFASLATSPVQRGLRRLRTAV